MGQFLRFGVVGVIGFIVDAGILHLAIWAGMGLYVSRLCSYLGAVFVTWMLNRQFTFAANPEAGRIAEFARFAVSQLGGAAVNLGLYALLVTSVPWIASHPIVAVAAGSIAGMTLNFLVARRYVFTAAT